MSTILIKITNITSVIATKHFDLMSQYNKKMVLQYIMGNKCLLHKIV